VSDRLGLRLSRLREASSDDHFYGPWKGGAKGAGGRPAGGGAGGKHEFPRGELPEDTYRRAKAEWDDLQATYPVDTISGVRVETGRAGTGSTAGAQHNVAGDRLSQAGPVTYSVSQFAKYDDPKWQASQAAIEQKQGVPGFAGYQMGARALVAHEYGHAIDQHISDRLTGKDAAAYAKWRRGVSKAETRLATARLSGYAGWRMPSVVPGLKGAEAVAEAFVVFRQGGDPHGIGPWLGKVWPG
jgi:hypothetical protein